MAINISSADVRVVMATTIYSADVRVAMATSMSTLNTYTKVRSDVIEVPPHDVADPVAHTLQVPDGSPVLVLHLAVGVGTRGAEGLVFVFYIKNNIYYIERNGKFMGFLCKK